MTDQRLAKIESYRDGDVTVYHEAGRPGARLYAERDDGELVVLTDDYNEHGQVIGCSWKVVEGGC